MKEPKISIIIPVYQVGRYLNRCLDSVINQTYKNLEIILVDDGSTDESPSICDEYSSKDERILVIHQHNQGVSIARNSGLDIASGEYIGFVDGDDWIELNMFEDLYTALAEDNADMSITGCYLETNKGTTALVIDSQKYYSAETLLEGTVLDRNAAISAVWSKLCKRELFSTLRFVQDVYSEDNICTTDLLSKKPRVAFVHACHYHYNKQNDVSITHDSSPKMEYGFFVFLQKYLRLSKDFLQNEDLVSQIKADILKKAIRCYMQNRVLSLVSSQRMNEVDEYLRNDKNYDDVSKLKVRYRILCYMYKHCRNVLDIYSKIRYGL